MVNGPHRTLALFDYRITIEVKKSNAALFCLTRSRERSSSSEHDGQNIVHPLLPSRLNKQLTKKAPRPHNDNHSTTVTAQLTL